MSDENLLQHFDLIYRPSNMSHLENVKSQEKMSKMAKSREKMSKAAKRRKKRSIK